MQLLVRHFEKGGDQKKRMSGRNSRVPATDICLGAYFVPNQKRLCKVKYGFEGSI